jgi:hypothetical protein
MEIERRADGCPVSRNPQRLVLLLQALRRIPEMSSCNSALLSVCGDAETELTGRAEIHFRSCSAPFEPSHIEAEQ